MTSPRFTVRTAVWQEDAPALKAIRTRVFVEEQGVPQEMEWDDADNDSLHFMASSEQGEPIGTARLMANGQIGRMAVLKPWRGRGVGDALLTAALSQASTMGYPPPFLNAQASAVDFYARHGFQVRGQRFMEAGIPHYKMVLEPE